MEKWKWNKDKLVLELGEKEDKIKIYEKEILKLICKMSLLEEENNFKKEKLISLYERKEEIKYKKIDPFLNYINEINNLCSKIKQNKDIKNDINKVIIKIKRDIYKIVEDLDKKF